MPPYDKPIKSYPDLIQIFPAYATITKLPIDLEQRIKDTLKTM